MSDELVDLAEAVMLRAPAGSQALTELEWDPRVDLGDADSRASFAAVFRGQGRALAATPALGALVADALLGTASSSTFTTVAAFRAEVRDDRLVVLASTSDAEECRIVVDLGGDSLRNARCTDVVAFGAQPLDPSVATRGEVALADVEAVPVEDLAGRRRRALDLARLAIAHEILGVSEHLMTVAVQYAHDRSQFGTPIGSFQSIQHLLAAAQVEVVGLRNACAKVLDVAAAGSEADRYHDTTMLKALAGRSVRRVAQATLQTLGAIGFTWEHEHHWYHRRALTLDALYGSYDELVVELGTGAMGGPLHRTAVL